MINMVNYINIGQETLQKYIKMLMVVFFELWKYWCFFLFVFYKLSLMVHIHLY